MSGAYRHSLKLRLRCRCLRHRRRLFQAAVGMLSKPEMTDQLPYSPSQLRWLLFRRLGGAAIVIGLMAGGAAYLLETWQVEHVALERATEAAGHIASPAMQMLLPQGTPAGREHLQGLLERYQFVGLRIVDWQGRVVYETWDELSPDTVAAIRGHHHPWPGRGDSGRNWIEAGSERLIQVIQPLSSDGRPFGYLEGIHRIDRETRQHQQQQVRRSALTALTSVFVSAGLLYPLLLAMLRQSAGLSQRLLKANLSLLYALGNAVAKRDSSTDAHNFRVTLYAVALAEAMGVAAGEFSDLVAGAFLHDVGKIGIPDHILQKPGRLTGDEFEIMKTHALLGLEIVAGNPWLAGAAKIIRHHHERFDGTGYPDGLAGAAIPYLARIFSVVDVFDALTAARPYKGAMPLAEALGIIERDAERHFDPEVVIAFKRIAWPLYDRMAQATEAELRAEMRLVFSRYFKTETAPAGAAFATIQGQT